MFVIPRQIKIPSKKLNATGQIETAIVNGIKSDTAKKGGENYVGIKTRRDVLCQSSPA